VGARGLELKHFTGILKQKFGTKMEHQLLPRHLRRRAMAHNYYRIPLRIRLKSLREMGASEGEVLSRSRCRRHRRKLTYLLNDFERRKATNGAWMETHIWHAKRFHMASHWGVKYPLRCADKSERSTYRLAQHNSAVIMDKSYYKHFPISKQMAE
jgi:ribonuclease P/MRP protein subunit POP1